MEKILAVMAVIIRKEDPTAVISSVFDGSYIDDESRELCRQFVCVLCAVCAPARIYTWDVEECAAIWPLRLD
jgi:hypothetical protein